MEFDSPALRTAVFYFILSMPDRPPTRIWLHELSELLAWYEENLCAHQIRDPRNHFVKFSIERFPHLIKLLRKNGKEVNEPQKQVKAIKEGRKVNADFGGYDEHRAQTLPWIRPTIETPTKIMELGAQPLIGDPKAGDTLYIKEFDLRGYHARFRVLVCKRVGQYLLVPVTCHPRDHGRYSPDLYRQVWPPLP